VRHDLAVARWRRSFLREVRAELMRLGLSACPVCGASELEMLARPRLLHVGGPGAQGWKRRADADEGIDHLIAVRCDLCGHELLFDSERYRRSGESELVSGPDEDDDRPGD
jgi:hypothetical protein